MVIYSSHHLDYMGHSGVISPHLPMPMSLSEWLSVAMTLAFKPQFKKNKLQTATLTSLANWLAIQTLGFYSLSLRLSGDGDCLS